MAALAWGRRVSPLFVRKVLALAEALRVDPNWIMACIAFESSETFSSSVVNRVSGATGLIQFMSKTAAGMGTSTAELAQLTPEDQLDYVARYFQNYAGKLKSLDDVYMVILWPKAVGKAADFALFKAANKKSKAYVQNRGLDLNKDGTVTKAEAARKIREKLLRGMLPEFSLDLDELDNTHTGASAASAPADEAHDPAGADSGTAAPATLDEVIPLPPPRSLDAPSLETDVAAVAAENARAADPSDYTIEYVQRRLRQLNYFTVGKVDGTNYGSFMRGAIARFKADKGLWPEDSVITQELLHVLRDPDCAPAPISDARANATVEELTPQNTTLWALAWQKIVAIGTAIGTAIMSALSWAYDKFGGDSVLIERVGGVIVKMPVWGWLGIATGVALVGWSLVSTGQSDQVQKHRRGELV